MDSELHGSPVHREATKVPQFAPVWVGISTPRPGEPDPRVALVAETQARLMAASVTHEIGATPQVVTVESAGEADRDGRRAFIERFIRHDAQAAIGFMSGPSSGVPREVTWACACGLPTLLVSSSRMRPPRLPAKSGTTFIWREASGGEEVLTYVVDFWRGAGPRIARLMQRQRCFTGRQLRALRDVKRELPELFAGDAEFELLALGRLELERQAEGHRAIRARGAEDDPLSTPEGWVRLLRQVHP